MHHTAHERNYVCFLTKLTRKNNSFEHGGIVGRHTGLASQQLLLLHEEVPQDAVLLVCETLGVGASRGSKLLLQISCGSHLWFSGLYECGIIFDMRPGTARIV